MVKRLGFVGRKIKKFIDKAGNSWQQGEKYTGLRSFDLWQGNKNGVVYKIFMTIPLLLYDIWCVVYLLAKILIRMTFAVVLVSICDPIRGLYKYIRKLWNRHKNSEWMYVLAQIAGLCSYVIGVRRHIVGGANRRLISAIMPPRLHSPVGDRTLLPVQPQTVAGLFEE